MCVFELDYSKSAQSSVTLSSKIGIDSLGFSFEASGFSERFEKFYADYASARNPSSFKRDTRIESKWEMLRDCFSFSLLFSFLVRLIFACKIREKHTRARASFPSAGKITFRKIHFRSFALSLARIRVAHDEKYLCSYARIRARTGDELPPPHCLRSFPR